MSQDFKNGKIYKITNNINSEVYVGSTCDILRKRFNTHKKDRNKECKKNQLLYKLMNELGHDVFRIDLIEEYPCDDKQALRQREGYWIRQIGTLNMIVAGRTVHEYEESEQRKELNKKWKNENKEKIKEIKKTFRKNHSEIISCSCGSNIHQYKLTCHEKSKKHIDFLEKNKTD